MQFSGVKAETFKRANSAAKFGFDFYGRVVVFENGRRLYSFSTEIARISRGDAKRDAERAGHELLVSNVAANA